MRSELRRAYAILNLSPPVDYASLKSQYRILAKQWHPDRHVADTIGQREASQQMRLINEAYLVVVESLRAGMLSDERPSSSLTPDYRLSRQFVDGVVTSINQANVWWPRMSRNRWLGLSSAALYVLLATAMVPVDDNRAVARALAQATAYLWLPLYFIWASEAEDKPWQWRVLFRSIGWILMAAPAVVGGVLWALRGDG